MRRDVVHAHDVGPEGGRDGVGGDGSVQAIRRTGFTVVQASEERLAGHADQDRESEGADLGQPAQRLEMLMPGLAEADPGSSTISESARPARWAIASDRSKKASMSATMSRSGSIVSRLCMMMTGAPCAAATVAMSGSRWRPQTSLTIRAPASSATRAVEAL